MGGEGEGVNGGTTIIFAMAIHFMIAKDNIYQILPKSVEYFRISPLGEKGKNEKKIEDIYQKNV